MWRFSPLSREVPKRIQTDQTVENRTIRLWRIVDFQVLTMVSVCICSYAQGSPPRSIRTFGRPNIVVFHLVFRYFVRASSRVSKPGFRLIESASLTCNCHETWRRLWAARRSARQTRVVVLNRCRYGGHHVDESWSKRKKSGDTY